MAVLKNATVTLPLSKRGFILPVFLPHTLRLPFYLLCDVTRESISSTCGRQKCRLLSMGLDPSLPPLVLSVVDLWGQAVLIISAVQ